MTHVPTRRCDSCGKTTTSPYHEQWIEVRVLKHSADYMRAFADSFRATADLCSTACVHDYAAAQLAAAKKDATP